MSTAQAEAPVGKPHKVRIRLSNANLWPEVLALLRHKNEFDEISNSGSDVVGWSKFDFATLQAWLRATKDSQATVGLA